MGVPTTPSLLVRATVDGGRCAKSEVDVDDKNLTHDPFLGCHCLTYKDQEIGRF